MPWVSGNRRKNARPRGKGVYRVHQAHIHTHTPDTGKRGSFLSNDPIERKSGGGLSWRGDDDDGGDACVEGTRERGHALMRMLVAPFVMVRYEWCIRSVCGFQCLYICGKR